MENKVEIILVDEDILTMHFYDTAKNELLMYNKEYNIFGDIDTLYCFTPMAYITILNLAEASLWNLIRYWFKRKFFRKGKNYK